MHLGTKQLALNRARWSDNHAALIGHLEARPQAGFSLLVDKPGEHSLALDWSAHGAAELGEWHFDLPVSPAPIATLELEVPTHFDAIFPQSQVVVLDRRAGDDKNGKQTWYVAFGGLDHLEIRLRRSDMVGQPAAAIMASVSSRYYLSSGQALCESTVDFTALRGEVSELQVDCDPELQVTEVLAPGLENWRPLQGLFGGNRRIAIRLREPLRKAQLRVIGLSAVPFSDSVFWTAPGAQIVAAVQRGETISVHLTPDLTLLEWRPNAFNTTNNEFNREHSQILTARSVPLAEGQLAVRPMLRLRTYGVEFRVRQNFEWEIAGNHSTLQCRMNVQLNRGILNQLTIRLPSGWELDDVENGAAQSIPYLLSNPGSTSTLTIVLPKPLTAGQETVVNVRLKQSTTSRVVNGPQSIMFPDVIPIGARSRHGEYVIRASRHFRASASQAPAYFGAIGPPSPVRVNELRYDFKGQPPVGPLFLEAEEPRFQGRCDNRVFLVPGQPYTTVNLTLTPEIGAPDSVVIASTTSVRSPWSWNTTQGNNGIVATEPLPLGGLIAAFGRPHPFGLVASFLDRAEVRWWRLTLSRPLDAPLEVQTRLESAATAFTFEEQIRRTATFALLPTSWPQVASTAAMSLVASTPRDRQPIPLVQIIGPEAYRGSVSVEFPYGSEKTCISRGMEPEGTAGEIAGLHRESYRFTGDIPSLVAAKRLKSEPTFLQINECEFVGVVGETDFHRCFFRCAIRRGSDPLLPIVLPAGAQLQGVSLSGQPLPAELCRVSEGANGCSVSIPLSADLIWQHLEILYRAPAVDGTLWTRLHAPLPTLPTQASTTRIIWRLPPGTAPLLSETAYRLPGGPRLDCQLSSACLGAIVDRNSANSQDRAGNDLVGKASKAPSTARPIQEVLAGTENGGHRPILDLLGLGETGVFQTTLLPAGLESVGLVSVASSGNLIVTSPRQLSLWRADGSPKGTLPDSVRAAVDEAAQFGRDASGRFQTVDNWLQSIASVQASLLSQLKGDGPGWTSWEAPDQQNEVPFTIVNSGRITTVSWILAASLTIPFLIFARQVGRRLIAYLFIWLTAAGVSLILLPKPLNEIVYGPMIAAIFASLSFVYLRRVRIGEPKTAVGRLSTHARALRIQTLSIFAVFGFGNLSTAIAPEATTVYLLPALSADGEPKFVLALPFCSSD